MALAALSAAGVKRAFATEAKALQVGFAVTAGVRAARLAGHGARADTSILDQWITLVGGDPAALDTDGDPVPGGLLIKLLPCSIALQRPAFAAAELALAGDEVGLVEEIVVARRPPLCPSSGPGDPRADLGFGVAAGIIDRPVTASSFDSSRPDVWALAARAGRR